MKRFHLTEEARQQKLAREATKIKNYKALTQSILTKKENKVYNATAFDQTTEILNINPEFYTIWNYRRDIITSHYMTTLTTDELASFFNNELIFNMNKFKQFPKVYWIWNHRVWILENHPQVNWEGELALVGKILALDARNFHGWTYRRFIVQKIEKATGKSLALKEFDFTTEKINNNFSNFSAWHMRTKLVPKLFEMRATKDFESVEGFLKKELELLKNAMYTDPEDQSVFIYLRWLLTDELFVRNLPEDKYLEILKAELDNIKELNELEKEDNGKYNNWCLKTIVIIHKLISEVTKGKEADEIQSSLIELIESDPLRKNRYIDHSKS